MRKNNFALLFLLVCLATTVFSIFSSLDSPTDIMVSASSIVEEVYVNSYDASETGWTRVGSSPYLHNSDADYIYARTNNRYISKFGFPNSAGSGTINNVKIRVEVMNTYRAGGALAEVLLWNGASWVSLGYAGSPDVYSWVEFDVSTILNTWEKINGAKLRFRSVRQDGTIYVRRATRRVTYTPVVGYNLNLRVMDWDLTDAISGAVVTMNNGTNNVKISNNAGWANYTGVSGSVTVSVAYYGKTVNGTVITVTADTTLALRCKLYDVTIKVMANSAVLCNTNVTVYDSTNNKIRTGFTNQIGYARLVNLPNATLTVTIYDGVGNILASISRSITVDEQTESISITQNYSTAQIPTLYILSYGTVTIFAKKRKGGEITCK